MKSLHMGTLQRNLINENFYFYKSHNRFDKRKKQLFPAALSFGWIYMCCFRCCYLTVLFFLDSSTVPPSMRIKPNP